MEKGIDQEFKLICREILDKNLSLKEWEKRESDDEFQSDHYVGGFDATEAEFCFSFYDTDRQEYVFQVPLHDIKKILSGEIAYIQMSRFL